MIRIITRTLLILCVFVTLLESSALAQSRNDVGLLLGGNIVPTSATDLNIGSALTYQATYAHRFTDGAVAFGFEVPFAATPSQDVRSGSPFAPRNYASLFLTPGLRVTFVPKAAISPWVSVGGGYARFAESHTLVTGAPNTFKTATNAGALQYGGGVDFKTPINLVVVPLVFRAEIRDFYSGQPQLNVVRPGTGQHNVIVSGGFVVRF